MGRDKSLLPFGSETLLQRVVRHIAVVIPVSRMVLVAAEDQVLPALPADLRIVFDRHPDRGPLEGLAAGLEAQSGHADPVFVTSCDVPLLVPAVICALFEKLGAYDVAIPCEDSQSYPLTAVYRVRVLPAVRRRLAADQLRLKGLLDDVQALRIPLDELRLLDPQLESLINVNVPEDYAAALRAVYRSGATNDRSDQTDAMRGGG